jgi:hypothetical protein
VDAELGIDFHQKVHVVRHDRKLDDFRAVFLSYGTYNLLQPLGDLGDQDGAAVLGTPYDVVLAGIDHVVVRFVLHRVPRHGNIIPHPGCLILKIQTGRLIPMAQARGLQRPHLGQCPSPMQERHSVRA